MGYNYPMFTTVKVTTVGNSAGIILSKEILERLRVSKGDTLTVTETPDGVQLSAYEEKVARQLEISERIMKDNRNMLRKLAK
jgi:putative addiction module antidote